MWNQQKSVDIYLSQQTSQPCLSAHHIAQTWKSRAGWLLTHGVTMAIVTTLTTGCATVQEDESACVSAENCTCSCHAVAEACCAAPAPIVVDPVASMPMSGNATPVASMPLQPQTPMQAQTQHMSTSPGVVMPPPVAALPEKSRWAPRETAHLPPANPALVCESDLKKAREEFDERLAALESQIALERESNESLSGTLDRVNGDVSRLSQELQAWQNEVRRIDRTTEQQHQSDMASLESISKMIDNIASADSTEADVPAAE